MKKNANSVTPKKPAVKLYQSYAVYIEQADGEIIKHNVIATSAALATDKAITQTGGELVTVRSKGVAQIPADIFGSKLAESKFTGEERELITTALLDTHVIDGEAF